MKLATSLICLALNASPVLSKPVEGVDQPRLPRCSVVIKNGCTTMANAEHVIFVPQPNPVPRQTQPSGTR